MRLVLKAGKKYKEEEKVKLCCDFRCSPSKGSFSLIPWEVLSYYTSQLAFPQAK